MTNTELLNKVQRAWPLRMARRLKRNVQIVLAAFGWCFWYAAWLSARGFERVVAVARNRCYGRMRRAWHVVRPFDTMGEEMNFVAQRRYDALFCDYGHLSAEERNFMVSAACATGQVRGLMTGPDQEFDRAN
jgi:hypothetical protein